MSDIASRLKACGHQLSQTGAPFEMEERLTNSGMMRHFKTTPASMGELLGAGRAHGDQECVVYENERLSFHEYFQHVDAFAYFLVNIAKIGKGQRIAIAMRNYPEWMVAYTAIISIGAIVVPLNSWGSSEELCYSLDDAGANMVVCDQQRLDIISPQLGALECQAIVARASEKPQNAMSFEEITSQYLGKKMPTVECHPEDIAQIMYTSGTTGRPKGAVSSHRNIIQAILSFEFHAYCSAMTNPELIGKMMGTGFAPCTLLSVPLFHVSGCYAAFILNLRGGRKTVMMYKWSPEAALEIIAKERVTIFSAVPTMVLDLLRHPKFKTSDTRSLFSLGGGGAACPPAFIDTINKTMTDVYVGTGYGMTESNAICASCTGEAFHYKPKSAGTLSPLVDWQTRDEYGKVLEKGAVGEIWIKSPCNITSYWKRPEANAETFQDGWMATGDIGYLDDENFVFLVDRAKDLIIRGGENIYPAEIEACLSLHPAVRESAVIAVPNEQLGETPGVVIRPIDPEYDDKVEIRSYLAEKLAGFKQPTHIWFSNQEMPRNAAGKVLKKSLIKQFV
jgi:long-chain acyl-CoA synthetase